MSNIRGRRKNDWKIIMEDDDDDKEGGWWEGGKRLIESEYKPIIKI